MWNPVCKVFVSGVEYTGDTLADVSINYGKRDISDAFRASYASVSLVSGVAGFGFDLNQTVEIKLQNSSAVDKLIFTGRILDIKTELLAPDWVQTNLSLLSPVARLGRRQVDVSAYPHAQDGETIQHILTDAGNVTWAEAAGTWASQDPASTWNVYEGLFSTIAVGDFELHPPNNTIGFVTDLIGIAELSGLGHLWEDTNGLINYQQSSGRQTYVTANGYETVPADDVILSGLSSELSTAFTTNDVQVKTSHGSIIEDSEPTSIQQHGRIYESFDTWLHSDIEAGTWASTYLGRYAFPQQIMSSFTIPLSQLTNVLRDTLIEVFPGLPVSITGLPAALGSNPYQGFVEGYQWRIQTGEVFLVLNVSEKTLSL